MEIVSEKPNTLFSIFYNLVYMDLYEIIKKPQICPKIMSLLC